MHTLSRLASSIAPWIARAASSGESPRALSSGGVSRDRSRRQATRSSKSGGWIGESAFSRGECPPYATSAPIKLASTVSTRRSVCVLIEMPSTRFSRSRAGHQELPVPFAGSSDFSKDAFTSRASVSSSPTWNFFKKASAWIPPRCRSAANACISPRESGRWASPILGATKPPRSTRISNPPRSSVTLRMES